MADFQSPSTTGARASLASPSPSSTLRAARIQRKYRRMQRSSPISATTRRKLLTKFVPAPSPSLTPLFQGLAPIFQLLKEHYSNLHVGHPAEGRVQDWIVVSRPINVSSEFGPLWNPRLSIYVHDQSILYKWQVWFHAVASGDYTLDVVRPYLDQLMTPSYTVCPGVGEYPEEVLRFKTKNLREWGLPFNRKDSLDCLMWHVPNNTKHPHGSRLRDVCGPCRRLSHDIQQLVVKSEGTNRLARLNVDSNYPLKFLSPESKARRVSRIVKDRQNLSAKLAKSNPLCYNIADKQHHELLETVRAIHHKGSKAIEQLCSRGDGLGEVNMLRAAWEEDVCERLEYEKDQAKSVTGSKNNRWSAITVRMALAVYTRSPAAYEGLKSFKLLQLPSVRTLKHYVGANHEDAGECMDRLEQERRQYLAMIEEKRRALKERRKAKKGQTDNENTPDVLPSGDGVLIIDEVKVGVRLVWSSRNQKFIGHCMSHDELSSLCDVYKTIDPEFRQRKTSYVLQTLWRDLTSEVDIIGPHYTSEQTVDHKFLLPTVMDALFKFHRCGFETSAIVCDGASSNLSMIKEMTGADRKAYGFELSFSDTDKFMVKTWFVNPYTDCRVHFVICPSHQLKNMVSALFQSRPRRTGGTRSLEASGVHLGWQTIQDMYQREVERIRAGQVTRVPKLKESFILRDSWTRLNVMPSKVMQQDEVISELIEFATSCTGPERPSVLATAKYLVALNSIFEMTLLGSKTRFFCAEGTGIQRLNEGFQFFWDWAEELVVSGAFHDGVDSKKFIAWQTWDLLRVMVYGFRGLVKDFLSRHPGHHVNPRRVNGSGVETLFGQLKHRTSGNLTGHNYESVKAVVLTRRQAVGVKPKDDYRDTPLNLRQSQLRRKSVSKKSGPEPDLEGSPDGSPDGSCDGSPEGSPPA